MHIYRNKSFDRRWAKQRHELINLFKDLRLHDMAKTFDEIVTKGLLRGQATQEIPGQLCPGTPSTPGAPPFFFTGDFF